MLGKALRFVRLDNEQDVSDSERRVSSLKVLAQGDEDAKCELLDFLNARVYCEFSIELGRDRRRPYGRRKRALKETYRQWRSDIQ